MVLTSRREKSYYEQQRELLVSEIAQVCLRQDRRARAIYTLA